MDVVEDLLPVRALEAGEAERLIEAAVVSDGEVRAEDHADAAADLAHAVRGHVGPCVIEKARADVVERRGGTGQEKDERPEKWQNARAF